MRLYVSGPMSGIPEYNFPEFEAVTNILRDLGHEVWSPAEMDIESGVEPEPDGELPDPHLYAGFLARDIVLIAEAEIEGLVMLYHWPRSGGAKTEAAFAQALGLPIFALHHGALGWVLIELDAPVIVARDKWHIPDIDDSPNAALTGYMGGT